MAVVPVLATNAAISDETPTLAVLSRVVCRKARSQAIETKQDVMLGVVHY